MSPPGPPDSSKRIAFIGGGNMATAIVGGLISAGYPSSNIYVSEPWAEGRRKLSSAFSVHTTETNTEAVTFGDSPNPADLIVLAVKPQIMKQVAEGIAEAVQKVKPVVVTIAAGITLPDLARWLGGGQLPIVRVMPNTPALVSEGATGLCAGDGVSEEQKKLAFDVLRSVSKAAYWVDREELLNVVTGVSGSGPAYFFLMVECLANAGKELGLPEEVALGLAQQTCLGAGRMLVDTNDGPAELRRKVTSPNGTTHAAVESMEANGVRKAFHDAVVAATKRGAEMGEQFSQ